MLIKYQQNSHLIHSYMTNQLVYFPEYESAMAVGKGFLDQYSVFCVFGSVVGCVVVPLITQVCRLLCISVYIRSIFASVPLHKPSLASCT